MYLKRTNFAVTAGRSTLKLIDKICESAFTNYQEHLVTINGYNHKWLENRKTRINIITKCSDMYY